MAHGRLKAQKANNTTRYVPFPFPSSVILLLCTSGITPPAYTKLSIHQASAVVNLYQNAFFGKTQNRPIRSNAQHIFQRFDHGA
jgi:hypothetical protein